MQYLLQSNEVFVPVYSDVKMDNQINSDFITNNVQLQVIDKQKQVNETAIKKLKRPLCFPKLRWVIIQ